jgi:hypothetical protein
MINCVSCLECKLTRKWTELTCKKGHWEYQIKNGKERVVRLTEKEIRTLIIKPRHILMRDDCVDFAPIYDE